MTKRRRTRTDWPREALPILRAASQTSGTGVRYRPTVWFRQAGTPRRRQRWSRWTRRLANVGWLERITQPHRDRVTYVRLTDAGRAWLDESVGLDDIAFDLADFLAAATWLPSIQSEEVSHES